MEREKRKTVGEIKSQTDRGEIELKAGMKKERKREREGGGGREIEKGGGGRKGVLMKAMDRFSFCVGQVKNT